jgi:hypothetical protein
VLAHGKRHAIVQESAPLQEREEEVEELELSSRPLSQTELHDACRAWSGEEDGFRELLGAYLGLPTVRQSELAQTLGVAEASVTRWLSGTSRPHPAFQEVVVARIAHATARQGASADGVVTALPTKAAKRRPRKRSASA